MLECFAVSDSAGLHYSSMLYFLLCFDLTVSEQTMTWDDHDIFDGWGSYPDTLQNCPVFQGCYQAALRFYLLFQQHTNLQRIGETDLFGHRHAPAFHLLSFGVHMS